MALFPVTGFGPLISSTTHAATRPFLRLLRSKAQRFSSGRSMMNDGGHQESGCREFEFQSVDGIFIRGKSWGAETGKPILALHGWMDNAASFSAMAPVLSGEGFHIVAIDHPGHGKSDHHSIDAMYSVLDYPFYAIEAAKHFGWKKYALIGHSLGAGISIMVASTQPTKVAGLVLLEGLGPLSGGEGLAAAHLARGLQARALFTKKYKYKKERKVYESFDEAVNARLATIDKLPGEQFLSREAAEIMVQRAVIPVPSVSSAAPAKKEEGGVPFRGSDVAAAKGAAVEEGVMFTHDPRLNQPSLGYLSEPQCLSFLSALRCPTLLVRGTRGWPYNPESVEKRERVIRETLKGSDAIFEKVEIMDAGHHLHLDPGTSCQAASTVVSFLQRCVPLAAVEGSREERKVAGFSKL